MVDEMDLLSGLKTADPVRPHAFEEARATLRAAMVMEDEVPAAAAARGRRPRWGRGRIAGLSVAAVGAAAAAVVLVVASTSSSAPGQHATAGGTPSARAKTAPAAVNPVLAQLAANIAIPQVTLPGNATMEIRNQSPTSATPGANGIDLYLNDGTYYWGYDQSDLLRSIASGQDVGQGAFKRSIAAALLAAKGDVATGRAKMSVANYVGGKPSATVNAQARQDEIEKLKAVAKEKHIKYTPPKPLNPAQKLEQTDNLIWMNSNFALTAAPENPNVRAGVLRILATMPNVKVTHTTTAGKATLTVSDSWPKLSGGDEESTVIDARTGLPIATSDSGAGQPASTFYYHPTRVSLAQVKAGKF
ncbi:MAG TPA: hypothetical protein VGJ19_23145 [Streptosporangiaceae bacterium]